MIPIRDSVPLTRVAWLCYGLIGLNLVIFLFQQSLGQREGLLLLRAFALFPARFTGTALAPPETGLDAYLTLVTSTFLHGGWLHVILNMWTLWIFGPPLEERLGRGGFLVLYLLSGVLAGLTHVVFNTGSMAPVLGASGAIAGVIAAYAVAFPTARLTLLIPIIIFPLFITVRALTFAVIWFGIQIMQGTAAGAGSGIAWWAHAGGFMAGLFLMLILENRRAGPPRRRL